MDRREHRLRMTEFFGEFMSNKRDCLNPDGTLPPAIMRNVVFLLLENCVFSSEKEIKKVALRAYGIILPHYLFDPERRGGGKR